MSILQQLVPHADRLRTQLTMALVIPTLLVGILIGAPLIESRRAVLITQEQQRAAQAGEAVALLFTERLRAAVQITNLLADRQILADLIRRGDRVQLERMLTTSLVDTPFTCLAIVEDLQVQLATAGDCTNLQPNEQSMSIFHHDTAGLIAHIRAPMVFDTERRGQLTGILPLDQGIVHAARTQPNLELGVVVDGMPIASSLPTREHHQISPANTTHPSEIVIGGLPYLAHYTALTDLNGSQVAQAEVLLPLAPVRAAQTSATLVVLIGLSFAVTLAIALGWLVARRISRLVDQLSLATAVIGNGDLAHPVDIRGPSEIRQLGQAIEWMRQQLARSRHELEAEKQRYADILESINEAVLTIDPDLRITSMNQGGEQLLGCPRTIAIGLPLARVIYPDDGRALMVADIPRHGVARLAVRTYTHQVVLVSIARSPAPQRGEQILVVRDVSEDAALRQLKDAFLANITHEFRTPLAAQIASLEILRDEGETLTEQERMQMLEALHTGVQRLDMLVQNLLESATIEAGYFRVEPEPCRIEPLVYEAVELMQPLVRQRRQQILVSLADSLPLVRADGQRLVQVLLNILANASKFGPIGDTICLDVRAVDFAWMQLQVTDHGPGIAESRRDRLFERFIRPGSTAVASQGIGLGLAIVKAIIDRHGGTVTATNEHPSGVTIRITIPIAP